MGIFVAILAGALLVLWLVVLAQREDRGALARRLAEVERRLGKLEAEAGATRAARPALEPSTDQAAAVPAAPVPPAPSAVPEVSIIAPPEEAPAPSRRSIEDLVLRRWSVWLGAVALALGGIFLVKYSVDQGYFGPLTRIVLGVVLGLSLLAASEAARRRPSRIKPFSADYVPPATAAAGIVALFASVYAGYALYDLIPGGMAFLLLAAVSFAAALLSLRHGPPLAWLGLVGAYVVPLLVASNTPSIPRLLAYVLVVTAGCLTLARWRDWPWLGWAPLAGSALWTLLAIQIAGAGDAVWIGLYILLTVPLFLAAVGDETARFSHRRLVPWSGAGVAALLMFLLALANDLDATSLALTWSLTAAYALVGIKVERFDRLPWVAAALQLAILAAWRFAGTASDAGPAAMLSFVPAASALGSYLITAGFTAMLAGAGGFVMIWRAPARADRWSLLSAATPPAVLAIAYWRTEHFASSLPWAASALVLAGLYLAAVEYIAPRRQSPGLNSAFAFYALATTAAVALGLTLSLRLGWLSVGLSLQLPAIAWLWERTGVRPLRLAALALGAVILLRLLLNPAIIDYPIGATPLFNGLLYLYGIPCAAFVLAAAWFRRGGEHPVVSVLEGGAIALGLALVSLEIRHLFTGGRLQGPYTIAEGALHADAWLAFGYALMRQAGRSKRPVQEFAWQIVAAVAGAHVAIVECLALNPLISPTPLGATPIFDVLLLAYAVPAVFAALYELALRRRGLERSARVAGIASLALGFLYISLEVRHLFHGSRIDGGGATDGEWYAYSVAWLVYGALLLALGIMRHEARLRAAGLAIGALVAVKAFGFDMAALTGLYRATSFLGLGASLIAIAWLYQRMGGRADAPSDVVPDRGA